MRNCCNNGVSAKHDVCDVIIHNAMAECDSDAIFTEQLIITHSKSDVEGR